jgi:hypothetical protein
MLGVLSIVIAISAGVFVVRNQAPNASLPDSFGGLSRIRNAQIDQGVELFRSMAETEGVSADMGVYGVGAPSAALVWVTGVVAPSGDDFAEFADGFNTGLGTGSLDQSRRTSAVVGGVTYECAPVVGTPPGSVCMWEQDDVFWIVFELSGATMGAAQDLAVAAHDVVQA